VTKRDETLDESVLRMPAERGVRLIALSLLANAEKACDGLLRRAQKLRDGDKKSDAALHEFRVAVRRLRSWCRTFTPQLRDAVSNKQQRHFADIAEATGQIRDATVHLEWLDAERRSMGIRQRVGEGWLRERLEAQQKDGAEAATEAAKEFAAMVGGIERRLRVYSAPVVEREQPKPFGALLARRVARGSKELRTALAAVRTYADVQESHHARIAAKRLRYLIEPLEDVLVDAGPIIETLKSLQDSFGDLHDVHVFSGVVGAAQEVAESPAQPGLVRLARRLHERGTRAYAGIARDWLDGGGASLFEQVRRLAKDVERRASPGPRPQ
jgi:CHAD domain-containing protein